MKFESNVDDVNKELKAIEAEEIRILINYRGISTDQLKAWIQDKKDAVKNLENVLRLREKREKRENTVKGENI